MHIHFFSLFLFPFGYLFQNLKTYMFLKFHQVTKSIYIIKVYWISLWIDYLAAGIFYKSIKPGVCDRSAKDAYSIMALDRTSICLEVCVCFLPVYVSPLNTVRYHHMSLKKIWLELTINTFQLPHIHQIITFCFLDGQLRGKHLLILPQFWVTTYDLLIKCNGANMFPLNINYKLKKKW